MIIPCTTTTISIKVLKGPAGFWKAGHEKLLSMGTFEIAIAGAQAKSGYFAAVTDVQSWGIVLSRRQTSIFDVFAVRVGAMTRRCSSMVLSVSARD